MLHTGDPHLDRAFILRVSYRKSDSFDSSRLSGPTIKYSSSLDIESNLKLLLLKTHGCKESG